MPTPITEQGNLSSVNSNIYTCPAGRCATITSLTFNNSDSDYSLTVNRVIIQPNPVQKEPVTVEIYSKNLDIGDTLVDTDGYKLLGGNSISASSDDDRTTYVVNGFSEPI